MDRRFKKQRENTMNAQEARNLTTAALTVDIDRILENIFVAISDKASAGNYEYFYCTDNIKLKSDIEQLDSRLQESGFFTTAYEG